MDFCTVLKQLRGGATAVELSEELRKVAAACRETLKPGKLTLTITINPSGNGRVKVADSIGSAPPKSDKETTLFFLDEDDSLSRSMPGQPALGLGDLDR